MYATRILADFVGSLDGRSLPQPVRDAAIRCMLDLFGAAAAGYSAHGPSRARRAVPALFGDGTIPVWFSGSAASIAGAVFCNAMAASALDVDDGNRAARGHPGAAVIPAALATAAQIGATADDLVAAVVAGYEVGVRVASARNAANAVSRQSGRWAGYAAAAAAGRLRRSLPAQLAQAFAVAGVTAPNQEANGSSGYSKLTGNDVKEGIPWSTVGGIAAVRLAEAGYTGPEDLLDFDTHFARDHLLDGLGSDYRIAATYFKPYSCCRYNHAAIDALSALQLEHGFEADAIEAIDVCTFGWALQLGNLAAPRTLVDAQYSVPYCLGVAAVLGTDALLPLDEATLQRDDIVAIARKVELHSDPALDARFPAETLARVVVTTRAARYESPVTAPRGEAANPMSRQALADKFRALTREVMPMQRQQAMLRAIDSLNQGDPAPLLHELARPLARIERG